MISTRAHAGLFVLVVVICVTPTALGDDGQALDSVAADIEWSEVEDGLQYGFYSHPGEGEDVLPLFVHLIRADLSRPDLTVRSLRPLGRSLRLEKIVEFFREGRVDVRAAMNGDYFSFVESEKDPLGLHVSGGQLLWFPANTSSLIVDEDNRVHMGRYKIEQTVEFEGLSVKVDGANRKVRKKESAVLYSGYYGEKTEPQSGCTGLVLTRTRLYAMVNRSIQMTVKEVFRARTPRKIAPRDLVLVVCGDSRKAAAEVAVDTVATVTTTVPDFAPVVLEAISGGPRVLRDGEAVREISQEGFTLPLRFYIPQRHPRSAVGISRDGKTVYMMVAEGRIKRSTGLSAQETAAVLKAAGAWDAMLFDGGGSSALMGPDCFYNIPHDRRKHTMRDIANALAVVRAKKR